MAEPVPASLLEALTGSQVHLVGNLPLRLPCVEDLLVMKAVAQRPKDLEDIEGLLAAPPEANLPAV